MKHETSSSTSIEYLDTLYFTVFNEKLPDEVQHLDLKGQPPRITALIHTETK